MRRSTLLELSGMELHEVAHVRRCFAGELAHGVRHAIVTPLPSQLGHGREMADEVLKHAIKQVDRLLSNPGIDVRESFMRWVPYMLGARKCVEVAMDWTDFDADNQATIMLSLITRHGRTTPLVWLSVDKATLKDNRNRYEYQVLAWLAEAIPADVKVLIVADRGFGDHKLYKVLTEE